MSSSTRALAGRIGAETSWSHTADRSKRTEPGRRAFMARFERQVDPNNELSPQDRAVRAEHARKAYFARLALASANARRGARSTTRAASE